MITMIPDWAVAYGPKETIDDLQILNGEPWKCTFLTIQTLFFNHY